MTNFIQNPEYASFFITNDTHGHYNKLKFALIWTVMNTKGLLRPPSASDLKAYMQLTQAFKNMLILILKPKQDKFSVNICKVALK